MADEVYVLDSFALMAHFQGEAGGAQVLELLEKTEGGEINLAMSLMNVGEVVYLISRERGRTAAESMLKDLKILPITYHEVSEERILAAAWMKAEYPISYADAFACALAKELKGILVTGDPEFRPLEKIIDIFWLEQ